MVVLTTAVLVVVWVVISLEVVLAAAVVSLKTVAVSVVVLV